MQRLKLVLACGAGLLLLSVAFFLVLGSSSLLDMALDLTRQQLRSVGLELEVSSMDGHPLRQLNLRQVRLSKDGCLLLEAPEVSLAVNPWGLIRGEIKIANLTLRQPLLKLTPHLLKQSGPEQATSAGPALNFSSFAIEDAVLQLPGNEAYNLERLSLKGDFSMGGGHYALYLEQGLAFWQNNGQIAFSASGAVEINPQGLVFDQLKLAQDGNKLSAHGYADRERGAKLDLELNWSREALPSIPAPPVPLRLQLALHGPASGWQAKLSLRQESSSLNLDGDIKPDAWTGRLQGQAQAFYPQNIYPDMPGFLRGFNLDGAVSLHFSRHCLKLLLERLNLHEMPVGQLSAELTWDKDMLRVERLQLQQPDGGLQLHARLPRPWRNEASQVEFELDNFVLPGLPMPAGETPGLRGCAFTGRGKLQGDSKHGAFTLLLDKIQPVARQPGVLHLQGQWDERRLLISQGQFNAPWGTAALTGSGAAEGLDLQLEFHLLDISPLSMLWPARLAEKAFPQGSLSGRITAGGTLVSPQLAYDISGQNLSAPGLACKDLTLRGGLRWREGLTIHSSLDVSRLELTGIAPHNLQINADLNNSEGQIDLRAHTADGWKGLMRLRPLNKDFSGWHIQDISFSGPQNILWQQRKNALLDISANGIQLRELRLNQQEQSLEADFRFMDNALQGTLTLSQLDLHPWLDGLPPDSRLNLQARLSGSTGHPELTFNSLLHTSYQRQPVSLTISGNYKNQQASLTGQVGSGEDSWLDIDGSAVWPLDGSLQKVKLGAKSRQLPLPVLQTFLPGVEDMRGMLDMDISLTGSWPDFSPRGYIKLTDAAFYLETAAMRFRHLNLWLECTDKGMSVKQCDLRTGSAEAQVTGGIDWPWREHPALDLGLSARELLVILPPWGRLTVDADVNLRGTYDTPELSGNIIHKNAYAHILKTSHSDLDEVVPLTSGQNPPPLGFGGEEEEFAFIMPAFLDDWRMNINMAMAPDFKVNFPQGWFQAGGQVTVNKEPRQTPLCSGGYTIDGGVIVVFGTRMESLQGYIAFKDPARLIPELNVEAIMRRGFTNITARLHGSAAKPVLSLTSDPPMSEADTLSMLAFGKPVQELNQAQGSNLSSQAMALAVIGEQGRQALQNMLGAQIAPDVITVHDEMQYGSSLEAGKYLTRDLYLRYRQGTEKNHSRSLGLEWQISPRVSLQGQVGTERDSGVDIIFHFVFPSTQEQAGP